MKQRKRRLREIFQKADNKRLVESEEMIDEVYPEIRKSKVKSDYLKKNF